MNNIFNFILWDVSPEWFSLGFIHIRWYGLLFALGFVLGQQVLIRIYKQEGKSDKHVETITLYMIIATVIGARLGHCLFYQPDYYLAHPIEILKIWEGGLASHGAAIGILIGIFLYSRRVTDQSYLYVLDRIVITIALGGCLIRLGNLMNSEIVGKPSDSNISFLFIHEAKETFLSDPNNAKYIESIDLEQNGQRLPQFNPEIGKELKTAGVDMVMHFRKNKISEAEIPAFLKDRFENTGMLAALRAHDLIVAPENLQTQIKQDPDGSYSAVIKAFAVPRLPSQLFEAISSFLLFILLWFIYNRKKGATPEGRIFGLFVIILFTLRFLYEFNKENQVEFESGMVETFGVNLGQLLSIPFVLAGLFIFMRTFKKKNEIS